MVNKKELVYAFDFGTGSLGEAVRQGDFIIDTVSLLVDDEVAKISEQRKRRRAFRTRKAHKAREESLRKICKKVGIPILDPDDERMLRQFPEPGDETCYTSCLLRIKLLRGEKLEGWQVYKALHSAIQRRGYGKVDWDKSDELEGEDKKTKSEDEKKFEQRKEKYKEEINSLPKEYRYPCYYDAWKMGLWDPKKKNVFRLRIDCHAERARDKILLREYVIEELRALLAATEKSYPKIKGRYDEILFGKAGKQYASYYQELREKYGLRRGTKGDWDGILGQKIPRFDNRIIGKCVLMPRRNTCRARDGLVQQVSFLLQLKNKRFERNGRDDMLSPEEMSQLLQGVIDKYRKKPTEKGPFSLTPTQWKKFVMGIGGHPKSAEDKVDPPSLKGRARFCRPALRLLRELLTTEITPKKLHDRCKREMKEGSLRLNENDIAFLTAMPQTWESFYIPDSKMDALLEHAGGNAHRAILDLISDQIDPVVRHRLFFFYEELQRLCKKHGKPDKVALEFVRDDFMGKKAKKVYTAHIEERKKKNIKAREKLEEVGLDPKSDTNRLKMKLFIEQDGKCLYTGEDLSERELKNYDIDHIVPRSRGGSDSYLNSVLTTSHANQKEKGDQTPYEWLKSSGEWEAYLNRVDSAVGSKKKAGISRKKSRLLTVENAAELDERYTTLAETAWIARLARKIVCLYFGWPEGKPGQERRCQIIPGGLTARVRAKYKLNRILTPEDLPPEKRDKKYRDDKRHHALDAMVLSYIPNWAADKSKREFFTFPKSMKSPYDYFEAQIAKVIPETVFRKKPKLEETFYGKRIIDGKETMVYTRELKKLPYKSVNQKTVFKPAKDGKDADQIVDEHIREDVREELKKLLALDGKEKLKKLLKVTDKEKQEELWKKFVADYRAGGPDGPCVIKVLCAVGAPDEYKDLGKEHQTRGQFRKGKKHQGYFVIIPPKGKPKIEPVYAFESLVEKRKAILERGENVLGYFFSGCLVVVDKEVKAGATVIRPGVHRCNSMRKDGVVYLGKEKPVRISTILAANPDFRLFRRED